MISINSIQETQPGGSGRKEWRFVLFVPLPPLLPSLLTWDHPLRLINELLKQDSNGKEHLMNTYHMLCLLVGLLLVRAASAPAQSGGLPPEAAQVLFLIDDSASMTETAFDPSAPQASRWEVLGRVFPQWRKRLGRETLVGALSVGGGCGAPPAIRLPVGTDRTRLATEIAHAQPHGNTNLNAALLASPGLFAPGVRGSKRIILLSDGLNTCPPHRSTCDIAQELHSDHGIIIDVVAWITEPKMVDEFRCIASATGGTFTAPQTFDDWVNIPLPVLDPWPYVVLALGFATLLLAASVLYRHGFHVLGWGTGTATLAGGMLWLLGILVVYLVLFVKAGWVAALLGGAVLAAMLAIALRREKGAPTRGTPIAAPSAEGPSPWSPIGVVLLACLLIHGVSFADDPPPTTVTARFPPRYHHILALDLSGSVAQSIGEMKFLLARYAELYALPGEELSLVGFAMDEAGGVKELSTFTVPESGSPFILNRLLDDLSIRNPKRTKTYFRPLADFLNQFLFGVRLMPVVVVVSDGVSDGVADAARGVIAFKDIPFESFGQRGVYPAPGMRNWKVAITGGGGLDLTALFQKPIAPPHTGEHLPQRLGPVIEPDLIDPLLLIETDETVRLLPTWNPLSRRVHGTLSIRVRQERVIRFRTFRVFLRRGNDTMPVGSVPPTLIDSTAKPFAFPVTVEVMGRETEEAVVQVTLDQGGTTRTLYPQKPATLQLMRVSYWAAFWQQLLLMGFAIFIGGVSVVLMRGHLRQGERHRQEIVQVLGGPAVPLSRFKSLPIGGEGCPLAVPGVAAGMVLATATWTGARETLTLQPWHGVRMKVNGADVIGSTTYRLGQPIQFITSDGNTCDVTLYPGAHKDIGFGTTFPGSGNGFTQGAPFPDLGGSGTAHASPFSGFVGIAPPDAEGGLSAVPGGSSGNSGRNPDTYI